MKTCTLDEKDPYHVPLFNFHYAERTFPSFVRSKRFPFALSMTFVLENSLLCYLCYPSDLIHSPILSFSISSFFFYLAIRETRVPRFDWKFVNFLIVVLYLFLLLGFNCDISNKCHFLHLQNQLFSVVDSVFSIIICHFYLQRPSVVISQGLPVKYFIIFYKSL